MRLRSIFTILYVLVWSYILIGLQTTIWPQIFSFAPAPLLWINFIIYIAMEKELIRGLFLSYLVGLCALPFTAMPLGMMLLSICVVYLFCSFLRHRIFWAGPLYYAFLCLAGNIAYQIGFLILSWMFETNSTSILFFDRIVHVLLNTLFSFLFFEIFKRLDRKVGFSQYELDGVRP